MSILKTTMAVLVAVILTACGGGGGDAGTVTTSSGASSGTSGSGSTTTTTTTTTPTAATMALTFTDAAGTALTTNAITSGGVFYAKAILTGPTGAALANALVTFSTDSAVGRLSQAIALTDASGVARVQIAPATITTASAASLTAQTSYNGAAVNASVNYQTSAASVSFGALTATPNSIQALQSSAVTTSVTVGGVAATAGQVSVVFTASCGSFSPATVLTSSTGVASSTYQSISSCSGPVTLTTNASGASTSGSGSINVAAATAANILFVSASPTSIVSSSATGTKLSNIAFKVVDSGGNPLASQSVLVSLDAQSTSAGVGFSVGGVSTATDQTVSTDAVGIAQVTIQSGALPTPVIVKAALVSVPTMFATSSGVVVTAGKASQEKVSLSALNLSMVGGLNTDGVQNTLTWRVSDRQGNPVPAGSAVTFVASSGTVGGFCLLDANSTCSVNYTTSGARPANGLVSILAYMDGEESFVDLNGNNTWDAVAGAVAAEPFTDVGVAYRDDNGDGVWNAIEQIYLGGMVGTSDCIANGGSNAISKQNTCDGTWSSSIRVRQTIFIGLASPNPLITLVGALSPAGFSVRIGDAANPAVNVPNGSTWTASVATSVGATACTVISSSPTGIRNTVFAGDYQISLSGTCAAGTIVSVSVTVPLGSTVTRQFTL